jgi:transposase InsO family protein
MAYQFMQKNSSRYTIKEMAGLFGVSRNAYYKWLKNGTSQKRKEADKELLILIKRIVEDNHYRYGSPRVHAELRDTYGRKVGRNRVARLMRENGLNARRRRKYITTTNSKHKLPVCENILAREFDAALPGEKWVSDITYLPTRDGWLYLTTVLDLHDRKIVGWSFSEDMETIHTTIPAFDMAVKTRTPQTDLIFHSDRGVQYCAYAFRDALRLGCPSVRQSMSRKGNCWDNACAESFFKTLKTELETLTGKFSMTEVRQSVFMYIETYYNRVRRHSAIDYAAPNKYDDPHKVA